MERAAVCLLAAAEKKWLHRNGPKETDANVIYIEALHDWFPTPLELNANSQVFSFNSLNKNRENIYQMKNPLIKESNFQNGFYYFGRDIKERE